VALSSPPSPRVAKKKTITDYCNIIVSQLFHFIFFRAVTTPPINIKSKLKKRSKKSGAASGSSLSVNTPSAPTTPARRRGLSSPAQADVQNTNAKEEGPGGEKGPPPSSTISTGYHEAHKFMTS